MTTATLTRTEPTSDRHVDPGGVARHLAAMQQRADVLRSQARGVEPLLASAYRRRAAEILLGAWAYALRSGHPELAPAPT